MVTLINKDHLLLASNGALLQSGEEAGASLIQTLLLFFFVTLLNTLDRVHIFYTLILLSMQLLWSPYQE